MLRYMCILIITMTIFFHMYCTIFTFTYMPAPTTTAIVNILPICVYLFNTLNIPYTGTTSLIIR